MITYEAVLAALVTTGTLYLIVSKCRGFVRNNPNGEIEWGFGFTPNDVLVNRGKAKPPETQQ